MRDDKFFRQFTGIVAMLALVAELIGLMLSNFKIIGAGMAIFFAMAFLFWVSVQVELETETEIETNNFQKGLEKDTGYLKGKTDNIDAKSQS